MAWSYGGESHSRRFALDGADWKKLGTGLLVALVGAVATFLADVGTALDFGMWSPFVSMALSVVVNALRKWLTDNGPPPAAGVRLYEGERDRPRAGRTTEVVVLVLAAVTMGLLGIVAICGRAEEGQREQREGESAIVIADEDREAVSRAFVLQRQLFAQVCLEAARLERSGRIRNELEENAWCEPRWAAARGEAFGLLADARDRQLENGWTAEESAAGLEAWAVAADPNVMREVTSR